MKVIIPLFQYIFSNIYSIYSYSTFYVMSSFLYWFLKSSLFVKAWIYTHLILNIEDVNMVRNIEVFQQDHNHTYTHLLPQLVEPIHFYIQDLENDEIQRKRAQDLIFDSIPIKLSFKNNSHFDDYDYYLKTHKFENETGLVRRYWNLISLQQSSADFEIFASNLLDEYSVFMLEFSGKYHAGGLHSDLSAGSLFGCYNFYHLIRGSKKVMILPTDSLKYMDLEYKKDSIIPKNQQSLKDDSSLLNLPSYYEFILREGEFIVFNNCDSMHKFENIEMDKYGYYPIAYSLRFTNRKRNKFHVTKNNYHLTLKADGLASIIAEQIAASSQMNPVVDNRAY